MKKIFFLLFIIATKFSTADGIDKVSTYLNDILIATSGESNAKDISVNFHVGDTLKFKVWTDWGGQHGCNIYIKDEKGFQIKKISQHQNRQYEAIFYYIIESTTANKKCTFFLDYAAETKLKPWDFVTLSFYKISDKISQKWIYITPKDTITVKMVKYYNAPCQCGYLRVSSLAICTIMNGDSLRIIEFCPDPNKKYKVGDILLYKPYNFITSDEKTYRKYKVYDENQSQYQYNTVLKTTFGDLLKHKK